MAAAFALMLAFGVQAQTATTPELDAARVAVQRADQADADQYAPEAIALARQSLAQAQAAHSQRDRRLALDLALRAAVEADLARALSLEAVANAELQHQRAQVEDLQRRLGQEETR